MMTRIFALLVLATLPMSTASRAGQPAAARADEAVVFEEMKTTMRFEDDGTGRREVLIRARAQSEAGVRELGQLMFGYNAATERLEFPFVRVRKPDGSVVSTPMTAIQDLSSPVERVAPVYTDFRQKHITVQGIGPGDTLEVSMVTVIHTALAPGHFWTEYRFNDTAIVLDERLEIDVPATRSVILKQAAGVSATTVTADGRRRYQWKHSHSVRAKPDDGATPKEKDETVDRAPIRLTSFSDWAAVGAWFAALERQARTPSPEVTAKARELTAGRATDLEKLEALYDYVSKSFRYVSLSLGMGRYQPRRAADVMREAYGDCKDKHTLLAALIDAAGLQASPVLMNSQGKIDPEFPSPSQFDHVITLTRTGDRQDVWLDATPGIVPFRVLQYGLRGKDGLVATLENSTLKGTPADAPMPAQVRTEVRGSLADNGKLSADVRLIFRGDMELLMRAAFHATARPNWDDLVSGITREAGVAGKVSAVSVSDPQATKEPFSVAFHLDVDGYAYIAGRRIELALPLAGEGDPQVPSESKPIELGQPGEIAYSLSLTLPAGARVRAAVPVTITRDYGAYRATYTVEGDTLHVRRDFTLKQRELPQARRADYLSFQRVLVADGQQRVSVDGSAIAAPAVASDAKAPELHRGGYDALEAGDYDKAIDLLKRALALDPKLTNARVNLARAYLERDSPEAALAELRSQIEQNPYDEYAYFYTARAYVALRQFAEAEQAFKKQLEVNPLDKYTPGALGAMYLRQKQHAKAAEAYEKATALNPDQAYAFTQLGKAYLHLQRQSDAMTAFGHAVELAPNASTWNSIAYELSLARIDLPRARRYAESAVASQSAASRDLNVERADARALRMAGSLSSYWDTLGWVHFADGDLAAAETFVQAAWSIDQDAEVGDHLGQIYERTSRKDAAIAAYARALAAEDPDPMIRERLVKLIGDADKVQPLVDRHRADLAAVRTFPLESRGPRNKKADFLVLFATPGPVETVKFIDGDEEMRALAPALQKLTPFTFPESTPAKLLRRAVAACNADGACSVTLLRPQDARPVK